MAEELKNKLKEINTKSAGSFFTSAGFPLLILVTMAYLFSYGFVGYKLWNWFILPIFSSGGNVTIPLIIGLFIFIRVFTTRIDFIKLLESKSEEQIGLIVVSTFGMPWLSLFIGYLVKFLLL